MGHRSCFHWCRACVFFVHPCVRDYSRSSRHPIHDAEEQLEAATTGDWVILFVFCIAAFLLDFLVCQRMAESFTIHIYCCCMWIVVGALYNFMVWCKSGETEALLWCTGYVLEWMLSLDNLFVIHLIFQTYRTPDRQVHKAVFMGTLSGLVLKFCFYVFMTEMMHWLRIPFGLLLIYSGVAGALGEEDELDESGNEIAVEAVPIRLLKYCLGRFLVDDYDHKNMGMHIDRICIFHLHRRLRCEEQMQGKRTSKEAHTYKYARPA